MPISAPLKGMLVGGRHFDSPEEMYQDMARLNKKLLAFHCQTCSPESAPEDLGKPTQPNPGNSAPHSQKYEKLIERLNLVAETITVDKARITCLFHQPKWSISIVFSVDQLMYSIHRLSRSIFCELGAAVTTPCKACQEVAGISAEDKERLEAVARAGITFVKKHRGKGLREILRRTLCETSAPLMECLEKCDVLREEHGAGQYGMLGWELLHVHGPTNPVAKKNRVKKN